MRNLQIVWVLAQGAWLPIVLWFDDLRTLGYYGMAIGVFILLEVLCFVDACLFLKIFKGDK